MVFRGVAEQKAWKRNLRTRARAELVDLRARQVVVEGVQKGKVLELHHNGVLLGRIETVALYFDNGRRVAILRKSGNDELDALHGRLLKAFYSIEVRT